MKKKASQNSKSRILIVDDVPMNILVLNEALKEDYTVVQAENGPKALEVAQSAEPPDLILLDVMMPGMSGFEVCSILKKNIATRKIPVIFVTAMGEVEDETKGFVVGAVDYLTKPINPPIVQARVKTHIALYDQKRDLEDMVRERTLEVEETRYEIIKRLSVASEYKDKETGAHIIRMSSYAYLLAKALGINNEESELIRNAAPMHDVGKIGIPDKILLKPGRLDPEEFEIIKTHTTIGAGIIGDHQSDLMKAARIIAISHHEKWDGSGYPKGLKGRKIHKYGRITAIADVFDALTSERPYHEAWPLEKTVDLIKNSKGQHFDADYVDAFLGILDSILEIKNTYID